MKKPMRRRGRVLIALLLAVTAVLFAAYIYAAIACHWPEVVPSGFGLTDIMLTATLYFVPIYLGIFLLWFIVTKCIDFIAKRKG